MVAPRSFPRPSVSTSVRASSLTDTPSLPFPSLHRTPNHMNPAPKSRVAPLRTLARLATTSLRSCVDAAALVRAHMHQLCMLTHTVLFIILPTGLQHASAGIACNILHTSDHAAFVMTSTFAAALAIALIGPTEAVPAFLSVASVTTITCLIRPLLTSAASHLLVIAAMAAWA
eukprot:6204155-Pleurochrysis_carterae.AAC.1